MKITYKNNDAPIDSIEFCHKNDRGNKFGTLLEVKGCFVRFTPLYATAEMKLHELKELYEVLPKIIKQLEKDSEY